MKYRSTKSEENIKVHPADGSMRFPNHCLKKAYVNFDGHAKFSYFYVMKLPKYDAIFGKPWFDRWNWDSH